MEAVRRADGVALALRSVSSLDVAVETVGEFCKRAGSGVDVGKTRCMLLGGLRDGCGGVGGVDITSDAVGCLGICIGHSGNRCCELGWLHSFRSVERLFESWRERGLAVFARHASLIHWLCLRWFVWDLCCLCLTLVVLNN